MKLYYLRGALGDKELLTRHEEAIRQLLTGVYHGSNLEKLRNQEVYSFRLSIRERLLFTVEEIRGQRCLIVLDYLPTHNYKDSRFLQAGVLKKYKERHVKAYEELIQQEEDVVLTEQAGEVKADISALDYYQNQWIALNVEQQQAIEVALPAVCSGVAGSGKSCLALSLIVNEALKPAEPESLPVVYVTRSSRLVEVMKDAYHQLPVARSSGRCVQFKTFNELVAEDSGVAEEAFVDVHYFKAWYDEWQRHQKKVGRVKKEAVLSLDAVSAYRECRIASGYSMEAYSALSDTSSCLAKGDGSRARLYEVYERYGQHLASVNKIDPCFYSFKTRHRFYRVFFDEAQDGSLCQLKEALLLAAEQGVIFLMDGHQRLYDHYSARQFLFQPGLVPEQNHIELTLSFRSPLRIMSVANEVIALKQVLAGGLSDKYEPRKIRGALEGKGLGWVSILSQEQTGTDPWLQTHSDKPYFAVVTRSEFFEEAKRLFPRSVLILTPQEIKGLEYDIVVTYKLYDPRLFQLIQARLKEVGDKEQPIHRPKAGASDDRFSLFLNECYTSYMRGTQVLVICEPEARADNPLLQKILPLTNQGERLSDACLVRETSGN
ncbi:hypothetical protein, partial [Legionella fairfieldensis]|uniref:hypothetical protein n=1 Tax=Legionella fairfieldensis TaxID=45064 RepID=UPI00048AB95E